MRFGVCGAFCDGGGQWEPVRGNFGVCGKPGMVGRERSHFEFQELEPQVLPKERFEFSVPIIRRDVELDAPGKAEHGAVWD